MSADLTDFLASFRPDGHTTFVGIVPDGSTVAETFNGADPGKAAAWIGKQNRARGVYFTVNPTPAGLRGKPTKADITAIGSVWADIDPQDGNRGEWLAERERLLALADELASSNQPPTFIIDSGNGIQPIWLLGEPLEATPEYLDAAEALCQRIEHALGAAGTHNVDRLLRVPGTTNFPNAKKKRQGRTETQTRLLHDSNTRYAWRALENLAADLEANPLKHARPIKRRRSHGTGAAADLELPEEPPEPLAPEKLKALREKYPDAFDLARVDNDESRRDMALACLARRLGKKPVAAWRLIISVRTDDKRFRRDYIERTIARAYAPDDEEDEFTPDSERAWPEPDPLPEGLPAVDPFPLELLPEALRPWVEDAAERTQAPPDYIAVAVIVALGSVLGRQIAIRPKRSDDWTVVPNLWGAVIGPPGVLKTPALEEALRHLRAMECEAKRIFDEEVRIWSTREEVDRERKKLRAEAIKKRLKDNQDPDAIARDLAADTVEVPPPTRRRYLANDATIEKLGELLHDNPNGVLLYRDELMGWLRGLETEGREAARAFFLEAWNGTGRFTYDRIGRGTLDIDAACIGVLGGIQPGPLLAYLASRAWEGGGADGLLQRFQFAVWPDVAREWRNVDRWPNATARDQAGAVFRRFAAIATEAPPATDAGLPFVRFNPEAQRAFETWRAKLERRLRAGDLHPALEAHLAKYRSLLPALALICHLADHPVSAVDHLAICRAEAWLDYLESHARRIYDALLRSDQTAARALGEHINALPSPFRLRDVYRPCWTGLTTKEAAQEAVDTLADLGWLRLEQEKPGKSGGRPAALYHVNPKLRTSP